MIYELIAILGYLTFGSKVGANIMAMYPATSLFIACGQLAIVILVLFSYPLQVHPCRNCLNKIIDAATTPSKPLPAPAGDEEDDHDYDHGAHDEATAWRHTWLTAVIIILGFTTAYFVSSLQLGTYCSAFRKRRLILCSSIFCGIDRVDNYFIYSPRSLLFTAVPR